MKYMDLSSQVTFLYFEDLPRAVSFFGETLGLEEVYNPGWACIFRTGEGAFVGAVNAKDGSIEVKNRGGVLVSLTVHNIEEVRGYLEEIVPNVSPIKKVKELDLQSFFFTGPEGYQFEIQQFTSGELRELF